MNFQIAPGKYIVAVSGGVDSMVLLDMLAGRNDLRLVVAHYDHGIRPDSGDDRKLVAKAAKRYGLPFVHEEGKLDARASEAAARAARYDFLSRVQKEQGARAIILAHHQDDVLETAILNVLRGTGRRGLTALASTPQRLRPLLDVPKASILDYAKAQDIHWREDSTNIDERYMRNYIRHRLLPRFSNDARQQLLRIIANARQANAVIDDGLREWLDQFDHTSIDRRQFILLPHAVAKEMLASWLRQNGVTMYTAKTLQRVVIAAKTQRPGSKIVVLRGAFLTVESDVLALHMPER